MNNNMSYYDLPVMLSQGFVFGLADCVLWGRDKNAQEWQAVIDGEFIYFGERRASGGVNQREKMRRTKFQELFSWT